MKHLMMAGFGELARRYGRTASLLAALGEGPHSTGSEGVRHEHALGVD